MPDDIKPAQPATAKVRWEGADLRSSYANVCNVSSTREEVVLLFGINQAWHAGQDLTVQLTDRIILSPFAAKRLSTLLGSVLKEYESRFGTLDLEGRRPADASSQ